MGLDVSGILIAEGRHAHCNLRGTYHNGRVPGVDADVHFQELQGLHEGKS